MQKTIIIKKSSAPVMIDQRKLNMDKKSKPNV